MKQLTGPCWHYEVTDTSHRIKVKSDLNKSCVQNWIMTKFNNRRLGGMPLPGNQFVSFVPVESMHALPILYIYIYIYIYSENDLKASCWTFFLFLFWVGAAILHGRTKIIIIIIIYIYMVATNPNHHAELFSFCLLGRRYTAWANEKVTCATAGQRAAPWNNRPMSTLRNSQTHQVELDLNQISINHLCKIGSWQTTTTNLLYR